MKWILLALFGCACLVINAQSPSFLQRAELSAVWISEKEVPMNPGWWNQYFRMKKNSDGIIPRLPYAAIQQHADENANRQSLIFNVEELGPENIGGRTRALMIDAGNQNKIYAGGVSGGLWISEDAGTTWNNVNDYLQSLAITCITQDPFNHQLIYIGTGESAGNSAGIPGNGIFKSEDGGLSFAPLLSTASSEFNYIHRVAASTADSAMLYVATNSSGLYRSLDGGDSLVKVFSSTKAVNDIEMMPSGAIWIGINGTGIFYSATGDSGTFVPMMNGLPAAVDFKRLELAYAPSDTLIIYAALEEGNGGYESGLLGMYKTIDGGQSWFEILNPDDHYNMYFTFVWYSMTMCVKPDDPNFVICAVGEMAYTEDGGIVWEDAEDSHADYHSSLFDPFDPEKIYMGNDGGVYRYNVNQIHYNNSDLNNGYSTVQYYAGSYFPEGKRAYGGTQDNGTHHCNNGDGDFYHIFGGDGSFNAVNQQYPSIAYVSYQNGIIQRTDDAYMTIPGFYNIVGDLDADGNGDIDDGAWFINPFEINLNNGDNLFFVTSSRVWVSQDGGYGWYPLTYTLGGGSPYAVGISNETNPTVYIGGETGMFYRVENALLSFGGDEVNLSASVPADVNNDFIASVIVHPTDKSICYVAFSNNADYSRVWRVTNADTNSPQWQSINGDLPVGLPVNYLEVHPQQPDLFFLAATDFGLYVSNDGGAHWVKDPTIPNVMVEQVKVRDWDRRVFIFTHGRGLWTATLDSVYNVGIEEANNNSASVSVYPNPCSDWLTAQTSFNQMQVKLFDMKGDLLYEASEAEQFTMDMSAFAPGIYSLQIVSGKNSVLKKIVKVK